MTSEIVKFRSTIPEKHRATLDTRLVWLWNQRMGVVQSIWIAAPAGTLDKVAADMIVMAVTGEDLTAIQHLLHRIEGGAISDVELSKRQDEPPESMTL